MSASGRLERPQVVERQRRTTRRPCAAHETTVLVAVSAPQVREALAAIVGTLEGYCVVAEAADAESAVCLARALRPTLAVVDAELAPYGGAWAIQTLCSEGLAGAVLAIGLRADEWTQAQALVSGARAYIQTGTSPADILAALEQARRALSSVSTPAALPVQLAASTPQVAVQVQLSA